MTNGMTNPDAEARQPSFVTRSFSLDIRNPRNVLLLAWLIFAAAFSLRVSGIGEYPQRHATDDEFHSLWAGLNFWDSGRTATWSGLLGSTPNRIGIAGLDNMGYVMVSPSYDHPPLFTLLSGAAAKLTNPLRLDQPTQFGTIITIWDVDLHKARWMMMPIFAATFWFLYGLAKTAFTPGVALLTIFFYGFMSHAAAQGRLILADNLAALILVASAWAIQRWLSGRASHRSMAGWTIGLTAAAILTKIPAACQVPALIAMLIAAGRPREMRYVFYGLGLGSVIYIAWLSWYGIDGFIAAMGSQADRFRGFNAFFLSSGVPRLLDVRDLNGMIIAGWFCVIAQVLRPGVAPILLIPVAYMLAFTFFAGDVLFGWYGLSMFPWLAMAIAVTTAQVFTTPLTKMTLAWLLLFLPYAFQSIYITHYGQAMPLRYAYVASVALLIFSMAMKPGVAQRIIRVAMITILTAVMLREGYEVIGQRAERVTDQEKYLN